MNVRLHTTTICIKNIFSNFVLVFANYYATASIRMIVYSYFLTRILDSFNVEIIDVKINEANASK